MDLGRLYIVLADIVLFAHALYVAFVVLGQLCVLIGAWRGWNWVRGRLFRLTHLAAIAVVAFQSWLGILCPLTVLENHLRILAGQSGYEGGFIAHWLQRLIYYDLPEWMFVTAYSAFGLLVVVSWIIVPPRNPRRRSP